MESVTKVKLNRSSLSNVVNFLGVAVWIYISIRVYKNIFALVICILTLLLNLLSWINDCIFISDNYICIVFSPPFYFKKIRLENIVSIESIPSYETNWHFKCEGYSYLLKYKGKKKEHTFKFNVVDNFFINDKRIKKKIINLSK